MFIGLANGIAAKMTAPTYSLLGQPDVGWFSRRDREAAGMDITTDI
jgi:hypothetical protein